MPLRTDAEWSRRCQHMVVNLKQIGDSVTQLRYAGAWSKKLEDRAYVFDQEMARLGINYYAAVGDDFGRRILFIIVAESEAGRVAELISRLESR